MNDQVTLEAYADENRALIHNNRHDEAIAICRHVLRYYPKHIDSYRQMGEAYLEKGELENAKDMFRRVLSADPENVIAYVGLATIFEQQHLIDEAIWHLERAYELAPGNFDINKELVRLHGEANHPRQRIKMTPAGLARLYSQEGLFSQALQELRAVTTAAPSRFDARVALAETLWRAGRLREAADAALALLTPLPYCLKANLILGAAWKESSLPESDVYLNRAQELDPTNKIAARLLGTRSPLPVAQISVPRHIEGATLPPPAPLTPAPIEETAVQAGESTAEEPVAEATDFFVDMKPAQAAPATETSIPVEPQGEPAAKPDLPASNLPPWLLSEFPEAGASQPETAEETSAALPHAPTPIASDEELPPWLTEPGQAQAIQPEAEKSPAATEGIFDSNAVVSEALPSESSATEELPDWLRALQAQSAPAEAATPAPPEETQPAEEYALPSFLTQPLSETASAVEPTPAPQAEVAPVEEPVVPILATQPPQETPIAEEAAPVPPAQTAQVEEPVVPILVTQPTEETPIAEEAAPVPPAQVAPLEEPVAPILLTPTQETPIAEEAAPVPPAQAAQLEEPVAPILLTPTQETPRAEEAAPVPPAQAASAEVPVAPILATQPPPETPMAEEHPAPEVPEETAQEFPVETPPAPATADNVPPIVVEMPAAPAAEITPQPSAEARAAAEPVEPMPQRKRQPKGYSHLVLARQYRDANRFDDALVEYDYLVQHAPRLVGEVIDDLEVLTARRDVPLEAHRILGDAYSRADRLAEALQRYQFVLERTSNS